MDGQSLAQELETVMQLTTTFEEQRQWLARGDWTQPMPKADAPERLGKRLLALRASNQKVANSVELSEAVLALQESYSALDHALRVAGSGLGEALVMLRQQAGIVYGSGEYTGRSLGSA
ncbi:hypothetical protein H7F10_07825 [Acidithiobacillus sp. HP-6]|uniref:hypothetical protein n=1 Tax=unclassified Acidithiobacillus TaxID=2614800 RepID=UPI00187A3E00|nr:MULTISPECIES: hypothetical protein [unclassified Acidithiobacillus]MBE7562860.1 hypothetical protein [Acidithiobacillus sp. HP-6]MBE7568215.1 hypothetical protein [Acidithiobacillus sp. HP-2]